MTRRDEAVSAYRRRDYVAAAELAAAHLGEHPEDEDLIDLAGGAYFQLGAIGDASRMYDALARRGDDARAKIGLARIAVANGETAAAAERLREALDRDPDAADAWNMIMAIHRFGRGDPLAKLAKRRLDAGPADARLRRELNFVLSKAAGDIGHWDRAWTFAEAGAAALTPRYDPARLTAAVAAQKRFVTADLLAALRDDGAGDDGAAPIFIVGMPRSGTTLVEKILEAHPETRSFGEAHALPHLVNAASSAHAAAARRSTAPHEWMADARPGDLTEIGRRYVEMLAGGPTNDRIIDKMPGNILLCGAIRASLKRAKIIWIRRDPLDACVSCYLARFGAGHHYAYRLDWLGRAWRDYDAAGTHYRAILGDAMIEIRYEDLVSSPKAEIRRLLDFVELSWDPACLAPERVATTSLTLSTEQVKRPISPDAIGKWRRHRKRIGPLAAALGVEIPD